MKIKKAFDSLPGHIWGVSRLIAELRRPLVITYFCLAAGVLEDILEEVKISDYKQLLDEVFVISRIIKVEVRVISRSRRLRLITLTETLIILDITKTESNNCFIIH